MARLTQARDAAIAQKDQWVKDTDAYYAELSAKHATQLAESERVRAAAVEALIEQMETNKALTRAAEGALGPLPPAKEDAATHGPFCASDCACGQGNGPIGPLPPWQPIETAPKDGRLVLVYGPGKRFGNTDAIYVCWWNGGWTFFEKYAGPRYEFLNATHWMPLPAGPLPSPQEAR